MLIGIDGSRAFLPQKTGTENYTFEMLRALARVDRKNQYRIYIQKSQISKVKSQKYPNNFSLIPLNFPRLFTQAGLALHTWTDNLNLLWVPAHTLPILGHPRLPMVITLHGVEYQHLPTAYKWRQNLHLTWSTRWAVIRAQKIITVSKKTRKDLINWLPVNPNKVKVIHEGVDLDKFKSDLPSLRIRQLPNKQSDLGSQRHNQQAHGFATLCASRNPRNDVIKKYELAQPYILFVGTLQPRKNLIRLIQAFSILVSRHSELVSESRRLSQLHLVVAGKPGWNYQEIHTAPEKFRVGDRVKFLGYVPDQDLPALYQQATLYVEPSLQEGFGLPLLEAMASGVPVAAANAGALPEVAGQAAILFNPHSSESISQALALALGSTPPSKYKRHPDLIIPSGTSNLQPSAFRAELIRRGYKQVKKFSWDQAARQSVSIFQQFNH